MGFIKMTPELQAKIDATKKAVEEVMRANSVTEEQRTQLMADMIQIRDQLMELNPSLARIIHSRANDIMEDFSKVPVVPADSVDKLSSAIDVFQGMDIDSVRTAGFHVDFDAMKSLVEGVSMQAMNAYSNIAKLGDGMLGGMDTWFQNGSFFALSLAALATVAVWKVGAKAAPSLEAISVTEGKLSSWWSGLTDSLKSLFKGDPRTSAVASAAEAIDPATMNKDRTWHFVLKDGRAAPVSDAEFNAEMDMARKNQDIETDGLIFMSRRSIVGGSPALTCLVYRDGCLETSTRDPEEVLNYWNSLQSKNVSLSEETDFSLETQARAFAV